MAIDHSGTEYLKSNSWLVGVELKVSDRWHSLEAVQ